MKAKPHISLLLVFLLPVNLLMAQQDSSKFYFQQAFEELNSMLEGKQALNFERAVFITENAYRNNSIRYKDFQAALEIHGNIIKQLMKANSNHDLKQFTKASRGFVMEKDEVVKERYRKALANWAIFTYLTDTTKVRIQDISFDHLPFTYSTEDPFGTAEWKNSQVSNLLETQRGNCYSLVTLFKIFSERLKTEANIVTAPQHIYIEHRDPRGDIYNVELATRSFPGTGSIEVLTYTTREALMNNIALRSLDLKQSIGLCLVYLAKGYENKFKTKDDAFLLACAEKALAHDTKNLNAMLLKSQVYEQRVMKKEMSAAPYENMLGEFYKLGYRQMPDDMKNIIMAKIQGTPKPVTTDKTPETVNGQTRYVTLSNGLFEEVHVDQKIIRYGRTIFDTEKNKIVKFLEEDNSSYLVDPVVFALSVDPLTKSYPMLTPYQFASNTPIQAIDLDGLEAVTVSGGGRVTALIVTVAINVTLAVGPNGISLFVAPEAGLGAGVSIGAGVSVGFFPKVSHTEQLGGWGVNAGISFMGNGGDISASIQQDDKTGEPNDLKLGGAGGVPRIGGGAGAEGHLSASYSFLIGTLSWDKLAENISEWAEQAGMPVDQFQGMVDQAKTTYEAYIKDQVKLNDTNENNSSSKIKDKKDELPKSKSEPLKVKAKEKSKSENKDDSKLSSNSIQN